MTTENLNLASVWERISDIVPDRNAIIDERNTRTWREYDDRAARLATALSKMGIRQGAKIGVLGYNRSEWIEAHYALLKMRAIPLNVNYRYLEDELVYLLDNGDAEGLVFESCFADRVFAVAKRLPRLKHFVQFDDDGEFGAVATERAQDFETLIAGNVPAERIRRAEDDLYILYTGGTTGMPRGAMFTQRGLVERTVRGYLLRGVEPPTSSSELVDIVAKLRDQEQLPVVLPACPLMHGVGMLIGCLLPLTMGGCSVLVNNRKFDPHRVWTSVQAHGVDELTIVGDAFAQPLLGALEEAKNNGSPYDISSLRQIISAGVIWTKKVKQGLLAFHDMRLYDGLGCTEGTIGDLVSTRENVADTAKFNLRPGAKVFNEKGEEITPGSGETGMVAMSTGISLGYYKDEEKTALTFRVIDGTRYCFPGDYAKIEADGTVILLGRGSFCINTAGEKVYPEEVESVLKSSPAITDSAVIGLPDELYGEIVVGLVSRAPGTEITEETILAEAKKTISGYKVPKKIIFVERIERAANGKMDYGWAKRTAAEKIG